MAYTTPRTWVAGEIVDKDMMNEQVRDNIAYLKNLADDNAQNISGLDGRIGDVENTLDELDVPDIGDLESRVGVNETDIGNIQGVLGSVTDLDTLSGKVTQNETDIGTINNTTLKSASLTKRTASNQFNTVFKNGSKLRLVTAVCVQTGISYHVVIEANNITTPLGAFDPPTSWAVLDTREPEDSTVNQVSITFIVPPLYYYTVARRGGGEEPGGHVEISYADLF
jgi:hypothetical protein